MERFCYDKCGFTGIAIGAMGPGLRRDDEQFWRHVRLGGLASFAVENQPAALAVTTFRKAGRDPPYSAFNAVIAAAGTPPSRLRVRARLITRAVPLRRSSRIA